MNKREDKPRPAKTLGKEPSPQCEEFAILLAEYWEGDAAASLRAEIERHTRRCPACAEVFESYRQTIRACRIARDAPDAGPSHKQLWDDLFRQIQALQDYLDK
jgi:anti-sigma factor RsiW